MLRKFTIAQRIIGFATLTIISILAFGGLFIYGSTSLSKYGVSLAKDHLMEAQRQRVKDVTHSAATGLESMVAGLPETEQLKIITDFVEKSRFENDKSGYFYVYKGTINVAHPTQKQLIGKDLSKTTDQNGVYYVVELDKVAKAGGGYVTFVFPNPNGPDSLAKLGYAEMIGGSPFWIGTGIYVNNIDEAEVALSTGMENLLKKILYIIGSIFLALLLLCGLPICYTVVKSIVNPLGNIVKIAQNIADGNLNIHIDTSDANDEVKSLEDTFKSMVDTLREKISFAEEKSIHASKAAEEANSALAKANAAIAQVEAKSATILSTANKLEEVGNIVSNASSGISSQIEESDRSASIAAEKLTAAAAAMNEMNVTVQNVAHNASEAQQMAVDTRHKAKAGEQAVENSLQCIQSVHKVSLELKQDMEQLNEHAKAISHIMSVISDIADQTNLLALNAAIEAARAGEAGRGFAVVADEVRKLAEKTMASTQEVGSAIQAIQNSTIKSAESVDRAVTQIEQVTNMAQDSSRALQEIVTTADVTAEQVRAIAKASEQQSATSDNINNDISECNTMSVQIADAMGEAAKAITELVDQAHNLTELVKEMKSA